MWKETVLQHFNLYWVNRRPYPVKRNCSWLTWKMLFHGGAGIGM